MDLSIIILTCNELDYLKRCLPSVLSQNSRYSYEIILIDNGSADGTIEYVEQYYPMLKIIRNGINLGVAKGRNQGAAAARGRYLLFLDVDTVVPSNALVQLIDWMEKNRGAAICGPKLVYPDGRLQYSCRTFPTPLTVLARGSFLGQFLQNLPFYKRHLYLQHNHG
ncbi:MAG: glycosyltransferase family 2 protein, partial [Parcubacteria group bacterium]|nr:glycosyltransferase family 2 protein [Parcubacteria group bacterium]